MFSLSEKQAISDVLKRARDMLQDGGIHQKLVKECIALIYYDDAEDIKITDMNRTKQLTPEGGWPVWDEELFMAPIRECRREKEEIVRRIVWNQPDD